MKVTWTPEEEQEFNDLGEEGKELAASYLTILNRLTVEARPPVPPRTYRTVPIVDQIA
jgi:hypothetical protein